MMEYKGYIGHVEFDDEANVLHGEIINIRDVVTFQATSVKDIHKAFRESVDDYLEFCKSRNESPDKPFSGEFSLRIPPELHRKVYIHAKRDRKSLNTWVSDTLEAAVAEE